MNSSREERLDRVDGRQSIRCDHEPLLLQPFNRLDLAYHARGEAHKSRKKVHRHWHERQRVDGKEVNIRPKRIGMPWRMLGAASFHRVVGHPHPQGLDHSHPVRAGRTGRRPSRTAAKNDG